LVFQYQSRWPSWPSLWLVIGSHALASADSDKAEIVSLNRRQFDAFNKKDLDAAMGFYLDDKHAVFYEDTIPFELEGCRCRKPRPDDGVR
jgi:hypothetical protein